jgi:hypothetical protein
MALVAMSFFKPSFSYAQKAFSPKIKTPNTSKELKEDRSVEPARREETVSEEKESHTSYSTTSSAPRRLQQHGLGLGIGQNFLMGKYGKYGQDKIAADILYTYAASYSFDLLVDAHWSEQKDDKDRMKTRGLTGSIKARVFEYDNFSPFVLGGLGFYAPKAKRNVNGSQKWTSDKVTFGANFGGGIDLRLNEHYVVGLLGQVHWPFNVQQSQGPDLKGYYFKLLLTGMYLF